jgi:predicted ribosome quality control (RQC) complex YloA/Tae2 family protein
MGFGLEDIAQVVEELRRCLCGARLEDVHQCGEHRGERSWFLTFRTRGAVFWLLFCLRPSVARTHLLVRRPTPPPAPDDLTQRLRSLLRGSRCENVASVRGERAVVLDLRAPAGGAEPREAHRRYVVQEFFGSRPNLLVLDEHRSVLAALEPQPLRSSWAAIEWAAPAQAAAEAGEQVAEAPELSGAAAAQGLFPVSAALAERFEVEESAREVEKRRKDLVQRLDRERGRRQRLVAALEADLERHRGLLADREKGELLKAALGQLRRGLSEAEVTDYFSDDLKTVRVALEPHLSPEENVERYFQRYRKARRAVPVLDARVASTRSEIAVLQGLEARLPGAGDLAAIEAIEAACAPLCRPSGGRRRAGSPTRESRTDAGTKAAPRGPRRFVSAEGHEIFVGRSARENDELTFRLARGNDVFLHASGRAGAHVIVRTPKGGAVGHETLADAAQLALYYSLPERSRGAFAAGTTGDVDYTEVKHVRKPRGARPGLVLLARHKTLRVRLDESRMAALRASVAREEAAAAIDPSPEA